MLLLSIENLKLFVSLSTPNLINSARRQFVAPCSFNFQQPKAALTCLSLSWKILTNRTSYGGINVWWMSMDTRYILISHFVFLKKLYMKPIYVCWHSIKTLRKSTWWRNLTIQQKAIYLCLETSMLTSNLKLKTDTPSSNNLTIICIII